MCRNNTKYSLLAALLLLVFPLQAISMCTNQQDRFEQASVGAPVNAIISSFSTNGCYGGNTDSNTHSAAIHRLLEYGQDLSDPGELEKRFLQVKPRIQAELMAYIGDKPETAQFDETRKAWAAFIAAFNSISVADRQSGYWAVQMPQLSAMAYPQFSAMDFLAAQCGDGGVVSEHCNNAVKESVQLIRAFNLMSQISKSSKLPNAITHLNDSRLRLQQWDDYFNKAEPLWFTELWLNSVLEMKKVRLDDEGSLIGFRDVPDKQHLFLHPTMALQYYEDEGSDSNMKPAILLDVYGVNFLDWNQSTRRLDGSLGVSLIASYSNHEGSRDEGVGIRVFNNKDWSFGVTKHSDRWGIFLSVGAVEQVSNWRNKAEQWQQKHHEVARRLGLD